MRNKLKLTAFILVVALVVPYVTVAQDTNTSLDTDTSVTTGTDVDSSVTTEAENSGTGSTDADSSAADSDSSGTSARDRLQNAADTLRQRAGQLRDDVRSNSGERADEERITDRVEKQNEQRVKRLAKLKNSMARHINRMQRVINRLQNIIDRIEGARDKLNDRGIDTSSVETLVSQAKAEKAEAVRLLDDAKAKHAAITDSENPRESVKAFISSLRSLKDQLIQLHKTLQSIVPILKRLANPSANTDGEDN